MKRLYILLSVIVIAVLIAALAMGVTYPMQAFFFGLIATFFMVLGKGMVEGMRKTGSGKTVSAGS